MSAFSHHVLGARLQQFAEVRNRFLDVALVGADQPGQADLRIVDGQSQSLADQPLGQRDERALAQVVGARLEAQPEQADRASPVRQDRAPPRVRCATALLGRIALSTGASTSCSSRQIGQRPQILRQARSAEGEARLQVGRRDVEARVAAHERHHLASVDLQARSAIRPTSFAKVIFRAWNALHTTFSASPFGCRSR